ncbi:MAG: RidA family protein [Gammaproteobacteria bacterium]|nr:RidA family protein [Gammaproteobacteria bacterium]
MIETLSSANLPAPRFRYSPLVKAGPNYQTAGMIALDKTSGQLEPGGAGPQTVKILENLLAALPDFGLSLDDMVSARIFTTEFDNFSAINAAWESVFTAEGHLPARTAVGVTALPLHAAVEMEFTFYKES